MSAHSVFAIFVGFVLSDAVCKLLDAVLSVVVLGCRRLDRDAVDNPGGTLKVLFVGICKMVLMYWFVFCITSFIAYSNSYIKNK